jgi:hypothetical protein
MLSSLLAALFVPAAPAALEVTVPVVVAPQDFPSGKGSSSPSGGTPEPTSMLLLVGGAVGYGVYRLKRAKSQDSQER